MKSLDWLFRVRRIAARRKPRALNPMSSMEALESRQVLSVSSLAPIFVADPAPGDVTDDTAIEDTSNSDEVFDEFDAEETGDDTFSDDVMVFKCDIGTYDSTDDGSGDEGNADEAPIKVFHPIFYSLMGTSNDDGQAVEDSVSSDDAGSTDGPPIEYYFRSLSNDITDDQELPPTELVDAIKADLADRLSVSVDDIELWSSQSTEWNDSSLGVPEDGMVYSQVITPGFVVSLNVAGQSDVVYDYHTDDSSQFVYAGEMSPLVYFGTPGGPGNTVTVNLSGQSNITVSIDGSDVVVNDGSGEQRTSLSGADSLEIVGTAADETVNVDLTNLGSLVSSVSIDLGGGDDSLSLSGLDGNSTASIFATGGDGNDLLSASGSQTGVSFDGGAGNDTLIGGLGDDSLAGGDGDDLLRGRGGADNLYGGAGSDVLKGGRGQDSLSGDDGDDQLMGQAGSDQLSGGLGDDEFNDARGRNTIHEEFDADVVLEFSNGSGQMSGIGNDILAGEFVDAVLIGGVSGNVIDASGFEGRTTLLGGDGNDTLVGGDLRDVIDGGEGNDRLLGNRGHDILNGGTGRDWLLGQRGYDTLVGGTGNDHLNGGRSTDNFYDDSQTFVADIGPSNGLRLRPSDDGTFPDLSDTPGGNEELDSQFTFDFSQFIAWL